MKRTGRHRKLRTLFAWLLGGLLGALSAQNAMAHNGPPFPIITDQRVGPCVISLWTHPDVGTGTFFVMVDPLPGGTIPKDLKIQIGVQPVSGRLAEVVYPAWVEDLRGQVEYKTVVEFDQDEFWKVRLILASSAGSGEALSKVGVGFLWATAMAKRRRFRKIAAQQNT